ncbi:hypothetical protein [Schlesneria paludicola]|uniref:hypothetical protein n=1 Tax=Schlesneria paludicola TaxID=360056 RepID=UPI00029AC211|nr:hypothetical protein [Schlesneria paludicola]
MLKLYKRTSGEFRYHEAWSNDDIVTEHWGIVGEQGESQEHRLARGEPNEDAVIRVLQPALGLGFTPISIDEHAIIVIEYAIEGVGTPQDLTKRQTLENHISETLGWTGLGNCDGGSIGSGTMEVYCYVVDFDVAQRVIEADLKDTEYEDYTRIYCQNDSD